MENHHMRAAGNAMVWRLVQMGGEAHAPAGNAGVLLAGGQPDARIILGWKLSVSGRRQQRHEAKHPAENGTNVRPTRFSPIGAV